MEPNAILARPEDHRAILSMSEAVKAMLEAFRNWAHDPLVGELRRRTDDGILIVPAVEFCGRLGAGDFF